MSGLNIITGLACAKELLRKILNVLFGEVALGDNAQDESPLPVRAIPAVAIERYRSGLMTAAIAARVAIAIAVAVTRMAVA